MRQFKVEYWTNSGRRVGMTISAFTALDAKLYAESLPDFDRMANYPTPV